MNRLSKVWLGAFAALLIVGWATPSRAEMDAHGRFAIGHINIDDTVSAGDFSATSLYYRYVANGLVDIENLSFNLDGNTRFSNQDYNDGIPGGRVFMANLKLKKFNGAFDVTVGRSYVEEFVSEAVDGLDMKMWLTGATGFGLFGGARPDPYTDELNLDYNAYGAYAFTKTDEIGLSAGYAYDTYKGSRDRERINGVFYLMPSMENLHMQATVDLDNFNEEADADHPAKTGWDLTNLLVHANWRPVKTVSLSGTYTQFLAINREASHLEQRIELLEEKYTVARVRAEGAVWKSVYVYGGIDQRNRETDSKNATQLYAGVRDSNFIGGAYWDVRYSDLGYFTSTVKAFTGTIGADVMGVNVSGSVTWMRNTQDGQMGDLEQWVYEVNLDHYFTKNIYGTFMWQYSSEKYLDIDSIYTTRYADNYNTTTLYGQVGYRF